MKPQSTLSMNLLIVIAGIILILLHNDFDVVKALIIVIGIVFIIPSALQIAGTLFHNRKKEGPTSMSRQWAQAGTLILSFCALALGICMVAVPMMFETIIIYLLALLLIVGGIYRIFIVNFAYGDIKLPAWIYTIPILMIIAGIVILATDISRLNKVVILITGIGLVLSGINSFIEYFSAQHRASDNTQEKAG